MFHEFIVKCRALGHTFDIQHLVLDFELAVVKASRHFFKDMTKMSNGVTCGQYKDKEEKTQKKTLKGPKNVKNENFEKRKKTFFP